MGALFNERSKGFKDPLMIAAATAVIVLCYSQLSSHQKRTEREILNISMQIQDLHRRFLTAQAQQQQQQQAIQQQAMIQQPMIRQQSIPMQQVYQPSQQQFHEEQPMPQYQVAPLQQSQPRGGSFHHTGNDLHRQEDKQALQDIYQIYHSQRGETCTGCAYVKPILSAIDFSSVLDAGAANCKVTRAFLNSGKSVKAVELSNYVLQQHCSDLVADGTAYNAAVHELDMFSTGQFDFVFCADVLEHVPQANVEETLTQFARVGTKHYFFVIHDAPAQKDKKSLTKDSKYKIHETVQPRSWWLENFAKFGIHEDKEFRDRFLKSAKTSMPKELLSDKQVSRLYFMTKE